jgi:glyoxylase-like metal-dependent hydrolase (beta-lactamase superfamily II)
MFNFVKQQNSKLWRWSMHTVGQVTDDLLQFLPAGPLRTFGFSLQLQVDRAVRHAIEAGDHLQERAVDWISDAITLKPFREAFENFGVLGEARGAGSQSQPELDFMAAVNDARPGDSSVIIPLCVHYVALNREVEGIIKFEGYAQRLGQSDAQKAVYLGCLALLRAARVKNLPPWQIGEQICLIRQLLTETKEAKRLTENDPDYSIHHEKIFARWVSGVLHSQLPWPFGNAQLALEDLKWCERAIHSSPDALENTCQFLTQVRYCRAILARNAGNSEEAKRFLKLSGYKDFAPDNLFLGTVFYVTDDGIRGGITHVKEFVPGKTFTCSGYDLSDINFFITDDGNELVAVDSGSRRDTCEAAYRAFEEHYTTNYKKPVPKLTHCLMTHYHWDHTGGHSFFRSLNSDIVFHSRSNYTQESPRVLHQPPPWSWTLGEKFTIADVASYRPTRLVDQNSEITIGGTKMRFILLPRGGGETPDGMLIHLYEHDVVYCGDFLVPWVGAPYVVEGDPDALLESMDLLVKLKPEPKHLLTGHWAVTQFFINGVDVVARLRTRLQWLKEETLKHIFANKSRDEIQAMNLIPPGLSESGEHDVHVPFIAQREVFIDRVYHQNVGYWGPQLQNVDFLSPAEFGTVFRKYLDLSDIEIAGAINRMITAGDFELAGQVADWAISQYPNSDAVKDARETAFLQLKQKWQILNVFKLCMYSQNSNEPNPQPPAELEI